MLREVDAFAFFGGGTTESVRLFSGGSVPEAENADDIYLSAWRAGLVSANEQKQREPRRGAGAARAKTSAEDASDGPKLSFLGHCCGAPPRPAMLASATRRFARCKHSVRLLPPALQARLFAEADAAPAAVFTTVPVTSGQSSGVRLLDVVVCRDDQRRVRAFENYCPHQGGKLFLAPDDGALQCRLHGAKFRMEDGLCVSGPCEGRHLAALRTETSADGELCTTPEAMIALAADGSGGRRPAAGWKPSASARDLIDAFAAAGEASSSCRERS